MSPPFGLSRLPFSQPARPFPQYQHNLFGPPEGIWQAAQRELPALAELGITCLELMPVADFPGRFGWGYDGVDLFAPTRLYGRPDDFRAFVDRAHALGLGVILDVVYNHLGPDGNYLKCFSESYFTDRYKNEWGEAVNFDGPDSGPVREFILANVRYWIGEFHLDGLRLDATQQMFDASPDHILAAITREVRDAAPDRNTIVIGENEPQEARLVRPAERGGYALDALWNDDFHHSAMVALTGRREAYYTDYRGRPNEFIGAAKYGFLYQGQRYVWQKKPRGTPALDLPAESFIVFLQNHDQVANSIAGQRLHALTSPGRWRAMTAHLLLMPGIPMLFQGQEFAASNPFLYFADHRPGLDRAVRRGRREFLGQFPSIAAPEVSDRLADPSEAESFRRSALDPAERQTHATAAPLRSSIRSAAGAGGRRCAWRARLALALFQRRRRPPPGRKSRPRFDDASGARAPISSDRGAQLGHSVVERGAGVWRSGHAAALPKRLSAHRRGKRARADAGSTRPREPEEPEAARWLM